MPNKRKLTKTKPSKSFGKDNCSVDKEKIDKFHSLIESVHLNSLYISSINFNRVNNLVESQIIVKIESVEKFMNEESLDKIFQVKSEYKIIFESKNEKKQVAQIEITYILYMSCDNPEVVNDALKIKEIRNVFLHKQIPKFSWPFLRNDVEVLTSKAGFKPFFLDLLK